MYIKGISKVLIVTVFLVSLFLFTPQRVEAAKSDPIPGCPSGTGPSITKAFGTSDTCCPDDATWKTIIPQIQTNKNIKSVISVSTSYFILGQCATKYSAITKDNTTISDIEMLTPGKPVEFSCLSNTCAVLKNPPNDNTVVSCYSQYEQKDNDKNSVCCVESGGIGTPVGSFKDPKDCTQAVNPPAIGKNGVQISVRRGNPSIRDPKTICTEDATNEKRAVDPLVYKDCFACLTSGKQWTALGCIDTGQQGTGIVVFLMQVFYGIGFTFILVKFILAGIQLQSGDPEAIKEAKETFIAGFSALFVAGFGLILLRFIGFDILGLGDFLGTQFPTIK